MSDRIIYRPPPYVVGPQVFLYNQVGDKKPWSLVKSCVPEHWAETTGEGVVVAVLDTGMWEHRDLPDPVFAENFTKSKTFLDKQGHGTHVAGTIGARLDGAGVVGWAPGCSLAAVKVLGDDGSGTDEGIAAGIRYAADMGAHIINMSLGGGFSPEIAEACREVIQQGVFVLCAAGNEGVWGADTVGWPAKLSETIAIASYRKDGKISEFSSRGAEVDIAFPGEDILSTWLDNTFRSISGTCIAEGSYVYTTQGPQKIEQISPGDIVYAFRDGRLVQRPVHARHERGTAETHRLIAAGRDVVATASHQMLTVNTQDRDLEWVQLGQLRSHHRLLLPRRMETQINPYLDAILTKDFCWLLGFFAGDGWLSYTTRGLRSCFAEGDKPELIAEVRRVYHDIVGKRLQLAKNGRWLYDDSTVIAMIVDVLGLNSPAQSKNFPLWLWNLPRYKRLAFYRGYLRADAHTSRSPAFRNPYQTFECTSPDLVRRAAIFADYEGWKHSAVRSRTRYGRAPNQTRSKWTTTHCMELTEALPKPGISALGGGGRGGSKRALSRFIGMGLDPDEFFLASWRVAEEQSCTAKVHDLNVPDADCFVTQGLVTHNSMATPACAGLTALMLASHRKAAQEERLKTPVRNNRHLREHLKKYAQDMGTEGFDHAFGWGVPDYHGIIDHELQAADAGDGFDSTVMLGGMIIEPLARGGQNGFFVRRED